jgi:hypothetical protein
MISEVMHGRAEGADISESEDEASSPRAAPKGIFGRVMSSFLAHSILYLKLLRIGWLIW